MAQTYASLSVRISRQVFGLGNICQAAFTKVIFLEEIKGSHASPDRQWKKLISERLANRVVRSKLLYAVKKLAGMCFLEQNEKTIISRKQ